ncbi:hypothetical protein [Aquimonas sp.]|jgi:hypothetical protein|uniref:hypothetical protein n=1 Tax=Aquimonas sp. TaxID=1872588 RepID=UPI0037BF398D
MNPEFRIALIGARGSVGSELIRLLSAHPQFERVGWDKPKAHPNVAAIVLATRGVGPRCAWPNLRNTVLGRPRTLNPSYPASAPTPGDSTP